MQTSKDLFIYFIFFKGGGVKVDPRHCFWITWVSKQWSGTFLLPAANLQPDAALVPPVSLTPACQDGLQGFIQFDKHRHRRRRRLSASRPKLHAGQPSFQPGLRVCPCKGDAWRAAENPSECAEPHLSVSHLPFFALWTNGPAWAHSHICSACFACCLTALAYRGQSHTFKRLPCSQLATPTVGSWLTHWGEAKVKVAQCCRILLQSGRSRASSCQLSWVWRNAPCAARAFWLRSKLQSERQRSKTSRLHCRWFKSVSDPRKIGSCSSTGPSHHKRYTEVVLI